MESNYDDSDEPIDVLLKKSVLPKSKLAIIETGEDGATRYRCVACPLAFDEKEELEVHLCVHFKEYRFLCGICGTGLKRKEHLERHTMEHQPVRPHECEHCGKRFKRKEHLNIHRSIHSGDKSQVCPLCDKSFYRKDHLQKHLQTHSRVFAENNLVDCTLQENSQDMDGILEPNEANLLSARVLQGLNMMQDVKVEHMESVDDDEYEMSMEEGNDETYNMDPCSSNELLVPRSLQPMSTEKPFVCPVCFKSYKRKDHLEIHSWSHKKKDKVCPECGKEFHRAEHLLAHMSTHLSAHTSRESSPPHDPLVGKEIFYRDQDTTYNPLDKSNFRPHQCPVCHKRFKRKQHLKVHAKVHLKQPATIWCSLCSEGFITNEQFEMHQCMPAADEEAGEEPAPRGGRKENNHPGEIIQQEYSSQSPAQCDVISEDHLPVPQRVFVCKSCSKTFKRKDHYKIHLNIHTGVKSFFCPECGKGFYRKDHLQKHALIHLKTKPKPKKKELPGLFPINLLNKHKPAVKPEITIHAPLNTKLRVPLQIKVPYQVVVSTDSGEQRTVTINPQDS